MIQIKYKKIVIGIDQSYTRTGIGLAADGKLIRVTSDNFKGLSSRSDKRKHLYNKLYRLIKQSKQRASEVIVLCERIRTFSQGRGKGGHGLRPEYLKMTGALIATVVDVAHEFDIKVYSVDTRSWKAKIVGTSKPDKLGNKGPTIKFVENLGFDLVIGEKTRGKNKGEIIYDDDAADSGCIALYGFLPKKDQNLKLEE